MRLILLVTDLIALRPMSFPRLPSHCSKFPYGKLCNQLFTFDAAPYVVLNREYFFTKCSSYEVISSSHSHSYLFHTYYVSGRKNLACGSSTSRVIKTVDYVVSTVIEGHLGASFNIFLFILPFYGPSSDVFTTRTCVSEKAILAFTKYSHK